MKTMDIHELEHATSRVLEWVAQGESVEITQRNEVVAVVCPPVQEVSKEIVRPDFAARLREDFGDRMLPTTGTELMDYDRGDR